MSDPKPSGHQQTMSAVRTCAYARLSGDFNPLHLDPDFAATTPFGGVIVHGSHTLALVVDQLEQAAAGRTLHMAEVRFVAPVPVGTRIEVQVTPDPGTADQAGIRVGDGALRIFLEGRAVYGPAGQETDPGQGTME